MPALHYQHTFVLTGLPGLLLLAVLVGVFVLGLVDLLGALASGVRAFRRGEGPDEPATQERTGGDAAGRFEALWAVPGKVRVAGATVHAGWIAISLGISALGALLR